MESTEEEQDEATRLHVLAMELCDQAQRAKRNGATEEAKNKFRKALQIEMQVVELAEGVYPARSILLKSAAVLASECEDFDWAYNLCGQLLADRQTPSFIHGEVLELLQDIRFEDRHLDLLTLDQGGYDVEFSLVGPGIKHGLAPADQVLNRINCLHDLVVRSSEFNAGVEYRSVGSPTGQVPVKRLYLSEAKAASFAVRLSFGTEKQQETLLGGSGPRAISDVMINLRRLDGGDLEEIRAYFLQGSSELLSHDTQMAYYRSFIASATPFLPDGKVVDTVGVGWVSERKSRSYAFKRPSSDFRHVLKKPVGGDPSFYTVKGVLFQANSKSGKVTLEVPGEQPLQLNVRLGLQDIVKQHFEHEVTVGVQEDADGKWIEYVEGEE